MVGSIIKHMFEDSFKIFMDKGLIRIENQHYRLVDALIGQDVTVQYDEKTINVRHGGKNVATLDKAKDKFTLKAETPSMSARQGRERALRVFCSKKIKMIELD